MTALVTGGSGSGKSAWAEELLTGQGARPLYYIATMQVYDPEGEAKVARHHALRAGKGFTTLERPLSLAQLPVEEESGVLVECLSNLTANVMFAPTPPEDAAAAIYEQLLPLLNRKGPTVLVTNEVFSDGVSYDRETTRYIEALGALNCLLAARCDLVVEVVCALPFYIKGGPL